MNTTSGVEVLLMKTVGSDTGALMDAAALTELEDVAASLVVDASTLSVEIETEERLAGLLVE